MIGFLLQFIDFVGNRKRRIIQDIKPAIEAVGRRIRRSHLSMDTARKVTLYHLAHTSTYGSFWNLE
jgi:hypothetical protein